MGHVGATERRATQLRNKPGTNPGDSSQRSNTTNLCDRTGTTSSQRFWVNEKLSGPTTTTATTSQTPMGRIDRGGHTQEAVARTWSNGGRTTANGNMGNPEPTKKTRSPSTSTMGQRNNALTRQQHVNTKKIYRYSHLHTEQQTNDKQTSNCPSSPNRS